MPEISPARQLIGLLQRHKPFDDDESHSRDRTLQWLGECPRPLDRNQFHPGHATGSAFIIDPTRQYVMLVLHGKLNQWIQPGGHAEENETDPLMVACRESLEEVGCALDPATARFHDIDVHRVPARGTAPEHLHFDFRYLFALPRGELKAASDALDARWFRLDEAIAQVTDAGVLRMIRKIGVAAKQDASG